MAASVWPKNLWSLRTYLQHLLCDNGCAQPTLPPLHWCDQGRWNHIALTTIWSLGSGRPWHRKVISRSMAEAARNSATMVVDQSSQGVHRQTHNKQRDLLDSIAADLQCETNNFNLNTWRPVANWQSQHITIGSWGGGKFREQHPAVKFFRFTGSCDARRWRSYRLPQKREAKSKWCLSEIEVKSKWNRDGFEIKSKWHWYETEEIEV